MSSFVALFHNRWSVPILAELHRQRGSRFVRKALWLSKCHWDHTGSLWYFFHHYNASPP